MLKLSDIATRAGVSPTTVSFVLNGKQSENVRISDKTRTRVLEAAEEMGYRHNQLARAMRTGNSRMLGVLGGNLSEYHVGQMLTGALEAADAYGYTLKIQRFDSFGYSAKQVIRRSSEMRLMGVLALHLPWEVVDELHTEASNYGYPLVLMDSRSSVDAIPQVLSDDFTSMKIGVEHLVGLGHTKIAYMSTVDTDSAFTMAREHAFLEVMKIKRLAVPSPYIVRGDIRNRLTSQGAAKELLTMPKDERPTAIFCSSDLLAVATLQAATELGVQIPKHCSVVGFANLPVCEHVTPELTTIEQPFLEMGRTALETLLSNIQHKNQDSELQTPAFQEVHNVNPNAAPLSSGSTILLPTRLVERHSTAPPSTTV
jgi:LacI family transcriptional regulator